MIGKVVLYNPTPQQEADWRADGKQVSVIVGIPQDRHSRGALEMNVMLRVLLNCSTDKVPYTKAEFGHGPGQWSWP